MYLHIRFVKVSTLFSRTEWNEINKYEKQIIHLLHHLKHGKG